MRRTHQVGACLLAVTLFTSGCYGPFYLTRKVWKWNGEVSSNKWAVEVAFLVMSWLPVYGLATLLDAVVFNSIEFWTGNNPVASSSTSDPHTKTKRIVRGDEETRLTRLGDGAGARLVIEQFRHGQPVSHLQVEQRLGATVGSDADGHVLFVAQTMPDGSVMVSDAQGKQVASYSSDRVERLARFVSN